MDIEKTMQFLLEQQARFDAHQAQFEQRMSEIQNLLQDIATSQIRTNALLATWAEQHVELERSHFDLSEAHRATEENFKAVSEAQKDMKESLKALSEAHRDTEESLKALSDAQRVTEHNLSALIITVERHIASHS